MIQIYPKLYIGNQGDYEWSVKKWEGWSVVHACKEPYHRQLLGYLGRSAPKDDPEYLMAERGNRLYLNLVDAVSAEYVPKKAIDWALEYIRHRLEAGDQVLVHCNQGQSRSPSIGLLYLLKYTDILPKDSLDNAEARFRTIYPNYHPMIGIRDFVLRHWQQYGG